MNRTVFVRITCLLLLFTCTLSTLFAADSHCSIVFDKATGEMSATPNEEFMEFLNMVPGTVYTDSLTIENQHSANVYKVYMQVCPIEQSPEADKLLELTNMQVSYHGNILYDGNMTGLQLSASGKNLQKLIYLGEYAPAANDQIDVRLTLSDAIPAECYDVLSQINWKFYATLNGELITSHPDMGDNLPAMVIAIALLSLIFLVALIIFFTEAAKKKRKQDKA